MQTLRDQTEEIKLLMQYAVPEEHRPEATELLDRYENDRIGLNLLQAFYSYLPEARDDAIRAIGLAARKQGNFLLVAVTFLDSYFYLVNSERAEFLGEFSEGVWEQEVLDYFGYPDRQKFLEQFQRPDPLPPYQPAAEEPTLCPACSAAAGEVHALGCPVEICPWCGGQLTYCNCRFDLLKEKELDRESQVELFRLRLEEKGRIPFDPLRQRPGFPSAGKDEKPQE